MMAREIKGHGVRVQSNPDGTTTRAIIPWQSSTLPGHRVGTPGTAANISGLNEQEIAEAHDFLRADLPPIVKQSGVQRKDRLVRDVWAWVNENMTSGAWRRPPASLIGQLVDDSWREGDPIPRERVEAMCENILKKAARKSGRDLVPNVGATGTSWAPPITGR